jgi:hypothetical protein
MVRRSSKADTGHAIQAAAQLDHLLLLQLLTKRNKRKISSRTAKTLEGFARRIRLAHSRRLIDPATHRDLKTINEVRIVFAHAELPVRFTSASVRIKARAFDGWKPRASARRLFDEAAARATAAIRARTDRLIYDRATSVFKGRGGGNERITAS